MIMMKGKRVLVTGSGRGIGKAIAQKFAEKGARIFLCARSIDELVETKSEIESLGAEVYFLQLNLLEQESAVTLVKAATEKLGGIDIVVSNAGAAPQGGFLELADQAWVEGFGLKMFANVRVIKAAWPFLSESKGSVVMIGGGTAKVPDHKLSLVSAINGGLASLSKVIAEQGYLDGIQVNLIQPGTILTSRREKLFSKFAEQENINVSDYRNQIADKLRIPRLGLPSDVAELAVFLSHAEARFIHGTIIDVDGGQNKSV